MLVANEVQVKLAEFAPQGLTTTAWAYSNFKGPTDANLLEAISKEVMQKLYEIEPQSVTILADAKLGCERHTLSKHFDLLLNDLQNS